MTGNFRNIVQAHFILQFIMNKGTVLCLVVIVSVASSLKLNRQRPSTVWGIQKKSFRKGLDGGYFRSRDGTYHFEYDTGNTQNQIFRRERRLRDGTVIGFFGYVDPEGILRITEYVAGHGGYRQRTVLRHPVPFLE